MAGLTIYVLNRYACVFMSCHPSTLNGHLARYVQLGLLMRRECRERFPRHGKLKVIIYSQYSRWATPALGSEIITTTCRDACRDR